LEEDGLEDGGLEATEERWEGGCDCVVDCGGGPLTRTGPGVEGPAFDDIVTVGLELQRYAIPNLLSMGYGDVVDG
jgi:hypothetical protein